MGSGAGLTVVVPGVGAPQRGTFLDQRFRPMSALHMCALHEPPGKLVVVI